ncbi:hypothetical protein ACFXJ8_12345 [Nonomuraea sp. NPDC059194]|uniref:hypothetical protein n=1 Tax=Nonomuraea sp. NPDC059194 TaxID=3346764 RepID=UPI0036CE2DB3
MRSDPDHVLDAIDGVVEDWESLSADSMRWAPPEDKPDSTPEFLREMSETFGPVATTFMQALRPLGEAVLRPLADFFDNVGFVGEAPEGIWDIEEQETACQCLCFRHPDQPDICAGTVAAGVRICAPCRDAL